jgi:hypothetical protein
MEKFQEKTLPITQGCHPAIREKAPDKPGMLSQAQK